MSGAALGAGIGYASSASGASSTPLSTHKTGGARALRQAARLRRAVSITAVVPDGNGKFATISVERGTLLSSSGSMLSIREGTPRVSYKTVTLTLPSDTAVRLARQPSSLAALRAGDRIVVVQGPRRTVLSARPPAAANTASPNAAESSSS